MDHMVSKPTGHEFEPFHPNSSNKSLILERLGGPMHFKCFKPKKARVSGHVIEQFISPQITA